VSFDDMETCFGCLKPLTLQAETDEANGDVVEGAPDEKLAGAFVGASDEKLTGTLVGARDDAPLVIEAEASSSERQGRAPLEITRDEVSRAIVVTDPSREQASPKAAGMARLHVKLPQGYHYDVYLEKPEGASIQLGWVPALE
jgi:hypothetical protein